MNSAIWVIKAALLPGSVPFLLLSAAVGVLLLYGSERKRLWGRRWLASLVAGYWFLSMPFGAALVVGGLAHGYRPIALASEARGATAIVVLDAQTLRFRAPGGGIDTVSGPSAFRAMEAARVYRMLDHPLVFVSGGSLDAQSPSSAEGGALRDELVRAGVPMAQIVMETESENTRAQAVNLEPLLRARGVTRIVLVTSPTHIRRATQTFRAIGIDVVPSPASAGPEGQTTRSRSPQWWPSANWLQLSEDSARDSLAIMYYWVRGWLRQP